MDPQANATWFGRPARNGRGLNVSCRAGATSTRYYLPLDRPYADDGFLTGEARRIEEGGRFLQVRGEELDRVLFHARRFWK